LEKGFKQVSANFNQNSKTSIMFYGGNIFQIEESPYSEWVESIPANPWLFGGQLKPITSLFPDSLSHKKIQTDYAYTIYLDKAYLVDIKIILEKFIGNVVEKHTGMKLIEQINELQRNKIPNHDNVTQIRESVDEFLKSARSSYGKAKIEVRTASVYDSNKFFELDPFCIVYVDGIYAGETRIARNTARPSWFETFTTRYINIESTIQFCIYETNRVTGKHLIGCGSTNVKNIIDKGLEGIPSTENTYRDNWLEVTIWWIPESN